MSFDAFLTLGVLLGILTLLALDRYPPAAVMLAGMGVLVLVGVVTPEVGFSGFSNSAPLTVAVLYVVAGAARRTGLLAPLTTRLMRGDGGRTSLLRLGVPVAGMSSIFNNTPLVAMLLPEVASWARRNRVPVSRFLMPLSFAAILGGTITVIGTSTNLVVSGVMQQQGFDGFGFFELTPVGLPVAIIGMAVMVLVVPVLLRDRTDPAEEAISALREYALHLEVEEGGELDGVLVGHAGLRSLQGVFLADIIRDDRHIGPVAPTDELRGGDLLVFVGEANGVINLRSRPGLRAPKDQEEVLTSAREPEYYEVVIGRGSSLVGHTLKEVGGREGYRAAAIAIHRAGENLGGKLGEVELRAGDMLVLLAGRNLRDSRRAVEDFLLISPVTEAVPVVQRGARIVALAIGVFVALAAFKVVTTLEAALIGAGIVMAGKVVTFAEAKRSIDLDVVLMVAAALGIGAAVDGSGLAAEIATFTTGALDFLGTPGVVAGILIATTVLTEIVTNNAAAAVIVPIAVRSADVVGLDPRVMAVGVAVMASSSFLTPIGYQTNAMVYGPGGYRFTDFTRVGGLVNLTVLVVATTAVVVLG